MTAEARTGADSRGMWSFRKPFGTWRGAIGVFAFGMVIAVALLGPLIAPHPIDVPIGPPGAGPSADAPLGTDMLGRDVLSRVLSGGLSVLAISAASIVLTYALALTIGMAAGLSRRRFVDASLLAAIDLVIVFPPLLLLLVLVAATGTGTLVTVIGVALVLFPGAARIIRTVTLEVSTTGFIENATARGERLTAIMRREVLPNILPPVLADGGIRFLGAIFLVASLNFLGVGSQPPSANWGLMIAENRQVLETNTWAVLAPAAMLAVLTVSVNLVADAYAASLGRSGGRP